MSDRFAAFVLGLCDHVATRLIGVLPSGERRTPLPVPLVLAIAARLQRMAARFGRLAALVVAGHLPLSRPRTWAPAPLAAADPASVADACADAEPRACATRLPGGFGWLARLGVPNHHVHALVLREFLEDPEMIALASAHPGFGPMLRALCRMLGVRPDPSLVPLPPPPPPSPVVRRAPRRRSARPPSAAFVRPLPHCDGLPDGARGPAPGSRRRRE